MTNRKESGVKAGIKKIEKDLIEEVQRELVRMKENEIKRK